MTGVPDLELRNRTGGTVAFAVRDLGSRRVVVVEIAGEDRGALRPADGENLAIAARTARDQRLPLVCFVESSGAAIDEGVAAVHGWVYTFKYINCLDYLDYSSSKLFRFCL